MKFVMTGRIQTQGVVSGDCVQPSVVSQLVVTRPIMIGLLCALYTSSLTGGPGGGRGLASPRLASVTPRVCTDR